MTKVLGKKQNPNKSGKSLLDPIQRNKDPIKHGIDIWNVYDFMYLNKNNLPRLRVLEIIIPYESDLIVESKSLKLYLNEFYKKSFKNQSELIKKLKRELESVMKNKIKIRFLKSFNKEPNFINLNDTKLKKTQSNKILKFNGFRSICPVTSQPDFANIYIYMDKRIDAEYLNKFLISFKEHGGFHEKCIDEIYMHLLSKFNPNHIEVCGRFQRRGGIDINPVRGNKKMKLFKNFREFNQ